MINPTKNNQSIITAGSGPSYSKWKFWPTWTRMLPLYFVCRHLDCSAPAAGNRYIARSVITNWNDPDVVLVQWNLGKYDIYIEPDEFRQQVKNSQSERNFIVDIFTGKTTDGPGYWCSSYDNTVEWKKYYNEHIKSDTGTAVDDLENMLMLQNFCARKNVKYRFTLHDQINHEWLESNPMTRPYHREIDWGLMFGEPGLSYLYHHHVSFQDHVEVPGHGRHVPVAKFQYWYLDSIVAPVLESMGFVKQSKFQQLKEIAENATFVR